MTSTTGRHDGDTWDLASSVGATATAVAASRAAASKGPDALLADPWAEPLVRAVGVDHFIRVADGEPLDEDDPLLNRRAMMEQMTVRTRFFDDFFVNASRDGVRQAVILAAGLDTRGYRLPWPAGTVVFEVDQPEVIEFKTRTLAGLDAHPTADHHTVPVDLRDDWPAALRDAGFDPARPSAWIAEGLLIYLPADAQEQLFRGIDEMAHPGSWVAVEEGRPMPAEVFLAKQQEERDAGAEGSFFTLVYNEQHALADAWFGARGWSAEATALTAYLDQLGRSVPPDDPDAGPMVASTSLVTATKE